MFFIVHSIVRSMKKFVTGHRYSDTRALPSQASQLLKQVDSDENIDESDFCSRRSSSGSDSMQGYQNMIDPSEIMEMKNIPISDASVRIIHRCRANHFIL